MGLFEKLHLVEKVPEEVAYEDTDYVLSPEDSEVEVNDLEEVNPDSLIEDIYDENSLSDKSKSIFKVEELINSLPKEMVTATKKTSVLSTLGVFGLDVGTITEDGKNRLSVLEGVLDQFSKKNDEEIRSMEEKIENHKKEIAILEKQISDNKAEMEFVKTSIEKESDRIEVLKEFIEGGEN